ncbi:MAG: aminotransferase class V-fold PLP-dependent enzyme [Saprospiraceae bacterium]
MINSTDVERFRQETPGCGLHTHLNNAGASLPPGQVLAAMQNYLRQESLDGGYETAAAHAPAIAGFYASLARLLNAQPRNIAWAANATDAFSKALSSIPFEPGDLLLTTDDDYVSNQIAFLFLQKRWKVKVLRAAKLPGGGVDPQSMQEMMDTYRPKLVAVTQVPTNSGLVQDVESIGQSCRERGIWYLVDACQSAGQMPLDVARINCDFLSATLRKWLRGPRGAGFLYVSDRVLEAGLEPIFPDLGGATWTETDYYQPKPDASRFEYWEKPYALLLGARAAVEYALAIGLGNIEQQVQALAHYARQRLSESANMRVLDQGRHLCGIVTAHHPGMDPAWLKAALATAGINAGIAQPFNALIDFREKGVEWALRISPHYYNTKAEIDRLVEVLKS